MSDLIPVVIAAHNEELYIARTLARLDADQVEPYVVVNASSDHTATIARQGGARVFEIETPGKMNAVQFGLGQLGARALGPVIYTDADTYPVFPGQWPKAMVERLSPEHRVISGLYIASKEPVKHISRQDRLLTSALRVANVIDKLITHTPHVSGANMSTLILDEETLEKVMSLEGTWPGQDEALAKAIDPDPAHRLIRIDPRAAVATSSRYLDNPKDLIRMGKTGARLRARAERASR
jgi:glycosyltransferase involved in cell wall biosynthesis